MNDDPLRADAEAFAAFLVEHYPSSRQWCDPVGYCAWCIAKGFIAAAVDDDGKIVAMCAMRPVDRPGLGCLPYYYNHNGSCLHIDLLVDKTSNERAIASFRELFRLRFGPRKTVAMFRHTEEALRVYPYMKFWNKLSSVKKRHMKKDNKQYGKPSTAAETTAPA